MFKTITNAGQITAQGTHVRGLSDGRVTVPTGSQHLTGGPVTRLVKGAMAALARAVFGLGQPQTVQAESLLKVSYDPARELYAAIDKACSAWWVAQGHDAPTLEASHGGSGAQARAVIDGLNAQVVTLAPAWAEKNGKDPVGFEKALYSHVPALDSGARGSTTTFAQRGIGDVLLVWENEAYLARQELGADNFEIVVPSVSVLAEPPAAIIDANLKTDDQKALAKAHLDFLYTPEGQAIIFKNFYRDWDTSKADPADVARIPKLELVDIAHFGGWAKVQKEQFGDGGVFDQI